MPAATPSSTKPSNSSSSARSNLVILDFDSTLFDLPGFLKALPLSAHTAFGLEPTGFSHEIPQFYARTDSGDQIGYDVYAHLAKYGIGLAEEGNRRRLIEATLAVHDELTGQSDMLYPEVADAMAGLKAQTATTTAVILTVNVESSLKFKLELCGDVLDGLPVRVVSTNKGRILDLEWQAGPLRYEGVVYETARVIDDNPSEIAAVPDRPDVTRLQIVRPGQKYPAGDQGIATVTSLLEALPSRPPQA